MKHKKIWIGFILYFTIIFLFSFFMGLDSGGGSGPAFVTVGALVSIFVAFPCFIIFVIVLSTLKTITANTKLVLSVLLIVLSFIINPGIYYVSEKLAANIRSQYHKSETYLKKETERTKKELDANFKRHQEEVPNLIFEYKCNNSESYVKIYSDDALSAIFIYAKDYTIYSTSLKTGERTYATTYKGLMMDYMMKTLEDPEKYTSKIFDVSNDYIQNIEMFKLKQEGYPPNSFMPYDQLSPEKICITGLNGKKVYFNVGLCMPAAVFTD
jgi:hypothetical protein